MNAIRARRPKIRSLVAALTSVLMVAGLLSAISSPAAEAQQQPLPIVFVHGFSGSGAQFEAQALRFASNDFPAERVLVFEYATGGSGGQSSNALNGFIDQVRSRFGVDQVHTVGHSLGTAVMSGYLGNASQRAKVASYIAVDGLPATCTGGPRCLTISAASLGGQGHVEAVTSPEAFARMYQHIVGSAPATTDIVATPGPIEIAGRAVNFPANTGMAGATLEAYELNPASGQRIGAPVGSTTLDASGDFEFDLTAGRPYEFALIQDGTTIHYYKQPFLRSNYIVRLNATEPDSGSAQNTNRGPNHVTSTVIRYQEWWPSHSSGNNDIMAIFTTDSSGQVVEEPVPVLQNVSANNNIGIHIHDAAASPGTSTLGLLPWFGTQAFQTGVDVFMPAEPGGTGTVTFVTASRGRYDMRDWQVINTPNWPSDEHHVIVEFNDFVQ